MYYELPRAPQGPSPWAWRLADLSFPSEAGLVHHATNPGPPCAPNPGSALTEDKTAMTVPDPRILQLVGNAAEPEPTAGAVG